MLTHRYYVYLMTNSHRTVIYIGVTNDLLRRVGEHRAGSAEGADTTSSFTARYHVTRLMYYEEYQYVRDAIAREKQLKAGPRRNKEELIASTNPDWEDLAADWFE